MTDTPMTPDVAAVQQAATRAIHALKSPTPEGSRHYQSGWDDGLEAAIDAARDGVEGPARALLAEVDLLRARVADLKAERAAVLALHRKHGDSDHCFADDETWPCQTRSALGSPDAGIPRLTGLPLGLTGRARHDARVAAETAPRDLRPGAEAARRMLRPGACDACGDIPDEWCPTCAACRTGCYSGHDGNTCTHPNAPWKNTP